MVREMALEVVDLLVRLKQFRISFGKGAWTETDLRCLRQHSKDALCCDERSRRANLLSVSCRMQKFQQNVNAIGWVS